MSERIIKSCPFCGSESIRVGCNQEMYLLVCSDCAATTMSADSLDGAVRNWNSRPAVEVTRDMLESVARVLGLQVKRKEGKT